MRKTKTITYVLLLAAVFTVLLTPVLLMGEDGAAAEPEVKEIKKADGKLPARLIGDFKVILDQITYFFLSILPVILLTAILKIFLYKRKLSLPTRLKPMEKIILGTISETAAEAVFIYFLMFLFAPVTTISLKILNVTIPVDTFSGEGLLYIARLITVIPYAILFGTILGLSLVHLVNPLTKETRSKYYAFGIGTSLIFPVLLLLFIILSRVVFQWGLI